jgi:hypothetical protein
MNWPNKTSSQSRPTYSGVKSPAFDRSVTSEPD